MIGLWGTIALVLVVLFVAAWFYDRRHKGDSAFGGQLSARRHDHDSRGPGGNVGGGTGGLGGFGDGGM